MNSSRVQRYGNPIRSVIMATASIGAMSAAQDLQTLMMRGWNSLNPIGFGDSNKPSSFRYKTEIPVEGSKPKTISTSLPYDISKPAERLAAILEGDKTKQLKVPAIMQIGKPTNISGLPGYANISFKGPSVVNIDNARGNLLFSSFFNLSRARNPNVTVNTTHHDNTVIANSAIRLSVIGNAHFDGSNFRGSSINLKSGSASMAGVKGDPTINGVRLSAIHHAAHNATVQQFPIEPIDYFGGPTVAAVHLAAGNGAKHENLRLAVPNEIFRGISENYAKHLKQQQQEMAMQFSQGRVRPNHDPDSPRPA